MKRGAIFCGVIVLGLAACASLETPPIPARSVSLKMAAPLGPSRRIVQQLIAIWHGQQNSLVVVLELSARAIAMAGVSNDGLSLFNLKYDGVALQADKNPLLPETIRPEFVISDLQLIYWPVAVLQPILPVGWRLQAVQNGRVLYAQDKPQAQINYLSVGTQWPMAVELINFTYDYRLTIKTLSYEVVPQ